MLEQRSLPWEVGRLMMTHVCCKLNVIKSAIVAYCGIWCFFWLQCLYCACLGLASLWLRSSGGGHRAEPEEMEDAEMERWSLPEVLTVVAWDSDDSRHPGHHRWNWCCMCLPMDRTPWGLQLDSLATVCYWSSVCMFKCLPMWSTASNSYFNTEFDDIRKNSTSGTETYAIKRGAHL